MVAGFLYFAVNQVSAFAQEKKRSINIQYNSFRDSLYREERKTAYDTINFFDDGKYVPGQDSFDSLLLKMELLFNDQDEDKPGGDTIAAGDLSFIRYNKHEIELYRSNKDAEGAGTCRELNCILYAEVVKSEQMMYLYFYGELIDTFSVSTGKGEHETPNLNLRPSGPIFTKYSSRKFPGGNYMGLGNMPYAVFLKGGYAIHGTTTGNIQKLGNKASHGCIRLHPDNARVFNELVKQVGLEYTWVKVVD